MESTNPCGEQPLLPYESCNLGSVNLGKYVQAQRIDWERLGRDIDLAIRFLDGVVQINAFPVEESARVTRRNRKIGLGVMGFADLLLELGIPYDSDAGRQAGEQVMSFLDRRAKAASAALAREKGAFPGWKGSMWQRLGYPKLRNATVSTVAPTGTISLLAGASSGIEPIFSALLAKNVLDGERLLELHPAVEKMLRAKSITLDQAMTQGLTDDWVSERLGAAWSPAAKVSIYGHIAMQAAFQRHSDSAVSKTINLPESAKPEDVAQAYRLAYELGCKGITIYRDRSRSAQVLEKA